MPDSLSFIILNESEYDDAWKNFRVGNVQFMQNCQYITTVNQSQRPVECSGVHDVERLSVCKRFEFICINSVRRPFKGNANSKNILREGTHLCESKIQKCKSSTQCRILNRHISKMDWEWWANPVWNIKWAWKQWAWKVKFWGHKARLNRDKKWQEKTYRPGGINTCCNFETSLPCKKTLLLRGEGGQEGVPSRVHE